MVNEMNMAKQGVSECRPSIYLDSDLSRPTSNQAPLLPSLDQCTSIECITAYAHSGYVMMAGSRLCEGRQESDPSWHASTCINA